MTRQMAGERRTALQRIQLLFVAALLFVFAAPSISSAVEQRAIHDAIGGTRPWPAPTGHRQPHAADVPPSLEESSGDDDQLYAGLDRRIKICRGC